jgi:hypothetical protein
LLSLHLDLAKSSLPVASSYVTIRSHTLGTHLLFHYCGFSICSTSHRILIVGWFTNSDVHVEKSQKYPFMRCIHYYEISLYLRLGSAIVQQVLGYSYFEYRMLQIYVLSKPRNSFSDTK